LEDGLGALGPTRDLGERVPEGSLANPGPASLSAGRTGWRYKGRPRRVMFSHFHSRTLLAAVLLTVIAIVSSGSRAGSRENTPASLVEAGDLDPSFSGDGKRVIRLPEGAGTYERHYSVAVRPDGKILLAGTLFGRVDSDLFVIRLTRGGRLDRSFSGDGMRRIDITSSGDTGADLLLQADGKILLAGTTSCEPWCYNHFLVVRLLENGRLDKGFGSNGFVRIDFRPSLNDTAWGLSLDRRSRIVVAGGLDHAGGEHDMAVARLHPNGSLDRRFSQDGLARVEDTGISLNAYAVTTHPQGGVIPAGNHFAASRFNPNGSLDTTFGEDGLVGLGEFIADDVDVMRDGRIVSMGNTQDLRMAAMRLHPDGSPDAAFGQGGIGGFPTRATVTSELGWCIEVGPS
jgi:uncharacterized delta-60 repeat protein